MTKGFPESTFTDEKEKQITHMLSRLILASWVGYILVFLCGIFYHDSKMISITFIGSILLAIPFWFLRKRHLHMSSFSLFLEVLGILTLLATFGQGYRDLSIFAFPIILVFTRMTLNRSGFIFSIGLMLLSVFWLVYGQKYGWFLPMPIEPGNYWIHYLLISFVVLVSAFAIDLLVMNMRINLERAQNEIDQRIQVETALRESEAKYKNIYENAIEGMFRTSLQGNNMQANAALARILGYESAQEVTDSVTNTAQQIWNSPEERNQFTELFDNQDVVRNYECQFKRKNGNKIWVSLSTKLIRDDKGNKLYYEGFLEDITERKRIMEQLEILKSTIDIASDAVYWMDVDGKFTYINDTGCTSLGYSRDELLKMGIYDINSKVTPEIWANVWQTLREKKQYTSESVHRRKDRSQFPVEIASTYVKFENKEYVNGFARDIAERKRMEEELQKSQKLESLGILAGGIAHDFNNLMGGVYGYIDLANEETKETKTSRYLAKAMTTIDRARALTLQLLTFAKGGSPVRKADNLFPFVQEAAQFALSGSTVSSSFYVQDNLWQCNFDRNQIGQVVDNIVINAIQAMSGGGSLSLTATNVVLAEKEHPTLSNGNYVRISIKDFGIGIPKETLPRIFDPFYTTKSTGHGLGLATCYSIVNKHGGCIDVESEPGKGSTFHVYLPATQKSVSSSIQNQQTTHKGN